MSKCELERGMEGKMEGNAGTNQPIHLLKTTNDFTYHFTPRTILNLFITIGPETKELGSRFETALICQT